MSTAGRLRRVCAPPRRVYACLAHNHPLTPDRCRLHAVCIRLEGNNRAILHQQELLAHNPRVESRLAVHIVGLDLKRKNCQHKNPFTGLLATIRRCSTEYYAPLCMTCRFPRMSVARLSAALPLHQEARHKAGQTGVRRGQMR